MRNIPNTPDTHALQASHTIRTLSPAQPTLIQRAGRQMATDISVQIAATPAQVAAAREAADACMSWFEDVDTHLSRFKPESELSRLNRAAGHWFAASELLFTAVSVAVRAARTSDGLFDPTLLRQLEALGYDRDFALIRAAAGRETLHPGVAAAAPMSPVPSSPSSPVQQAYWRAIEFDHPRRRIRLPVGAQLDLGGIAKGWAADVALHRFCLPFLGALINVGGDLRVHGGPQPGESWSIGLRDPRSEATAQDSQETTGASASQTNYVATLRFSRGGLATSGALRRWWRRDGQRRHHLLDPRTGEPVKLWINEGDTLPDSDRTDHATPLIATATALAPTAARAEIAAKVALLRGYPAALQAVEAAWERPITLDATLDADAAIALVLTFGNGEVVFSKNLPTYLATWGTDGATLPIAASTTIIGALQ